MSRAPTSHVRSRTVLAGPRGWVAPLMVLPFLALFGCERGPSEAGDARKANVANGIRPAGAANGRMLRFTDITEPAGLRFRHDSGARGKKYNPETFGPGAGWIDYDVDGHIDLL